MIAGYITMPFHIIKHIAFYDTVIGNAFAFFFFFNKSDTIQSSYSCKEKNRHIKVKYDLLC